MQTHSSILPLFQSSTAFRFTFANKLTNIYAGAQNANHRYFYDLAGNLVTSIVSSITNLYFYNAQNKLARVLTHRSNLQQQERIEYLFGYDSLNRRVSITRSVTSVLYTTETRVTIHDGTVPLAELTPEPGGARIYRYFVRGAGIAEGTGDVIAEVLHSGGSPDAMFYLSNHRGDTLAVYMNYNATPYRAAKYRYDAFGNIRESDALYTPRYLFSTKEYLPDAKLYLYQYRVYDPIAGRWTQRDPIDYQDSINLYQFCGNNPVNLWDVDGRIIWKQFRRGIGGALAGVALFGIGAKAAALTAPSGVGLVAGGAIAVAGITCVGLGLGVAAAAVADVPTDKIPVSLGEGAATATKATIASDNPHVNAVIDAVGIAIDCALCPKSGPYNAIGTASTALSGSVVIDDATERYKADLAKRGSQSETKSHH